MSAAEERIGNDPTSELWGEHRSRYRFASQHVAGKRVLDVACGSGFGLHMLAEAGARSVVGVDYDSEALRSEVRRTYRDAALVRADATCLPLASASTDVAVSFETLEHVADAGALVAELRRVLKPGGSLVLSTPNREFGPPERHTNNPFHVREFTPLELRQLLEECFRDVRLFGQRPSADYRYVPFLMLEPTFQPSALLWKGQLRLPFGLRNRVALALSGRPFYPGEGDYCFDEAQTDGSHALIAVAQ